MVDSVAVLPWAMPILDSNGDPVAGGSIEFYDAGTTDARTVYSTKDLSTTSLGTTVTLNSAGIPVNGSNTPVLIYTGSTDYKVIIKTSADVTLYTFDNIKGAIDTSSFGSGTGTFSSEIDASAGDITLVVGDAGKLKNLDCSGGDITATLESAVTVGDGHIVGIRHNGNANEIRIATVSGQTIQLPGSTTSAGFALTGKGHTVWLVSDGAGYVVAWEVPPLITPNTGIIQIVDRLSAPPSSPEPGARYIINDTPSSAWPEQSGHTIALHNVAEADGQGGFFYFAPPTNCGWLAYVQDETLYTSFQSSAWSDQTGMGAAQTSFEKRAIFRYKQDSGTSGGSSTASAWTLYPTNDFQNTGATNVIASTALSSNVIQSLPQGRYRIQGFATFRGPAHAQVRLYNNTDSAVAVEGLRSFLDNSASPGDVRALIDGEFTVDSDGGTGGVGEDFQIEYYVTNATATVGLGGASSVAGDEIYGVFTISDLEALQGSQGSQGTQGNTGPGYQATSTTSLAIGTGSKVFTTQSGLAYTAGARVKAASAADTNNFMVGNVDSYSGTTLTVTVDKIGGSGTLADWNINVAGEDGAAGSTGATGVFMLDLQWETATSGDPGSGKIRVDNGTYASLSEFAISETDRLGNDISGLIAALDNSSSSVKFTAYIVDVSDATNFLIVQITSTLTDQGTYDTFTASYVDHGGTLADDQNVVLIPLPTGDAGAGLAAVVDDTTPQLGGTLDTNSQQIRWSKGADVASGSALSLGNDGNYFDITGTTAITSINTKAVGTVVMLQFDGALTLTHHATDLVLPGGDNITTAAGDHAIFVEYATGDWRLVAYQDAHTLKANKTDDLTVGYTSTPNNLGTLTTGTTTPDPANGQFQYATNGGAHTLAAPTATGSYSIILTYTNNGSAGAVTTSGFTVETGDTLTTTNGDDFELTIIKNNGFVSLHVKALQ